MTSPGVEVSPIKQASGRFEFNEVFLTDVFVPDDMLVGKPDDGWSLAVSTMAVERTAIGNYVSIDRAEALRRMAEIAGPEQDAALRALGDVEAYSTAIKSLVLRETLRLVEGQGPGPTSSIAKYAMVTLLRRAWTATLGADRPHRDVGEVRTGGRSAIFRLARRTHRWRDPGDPADGHRVDGPRPAAQLKATSLQKGHPR